MTVSVCLTVELDGTALWSGTMKASNASDLSKGEFERVAVPRLLRLLARYRVASTWFVPGAVATTFPDLASSVVEHGHELAHHGWAHEGVFDDCVANRRVLEHGLEALEAVAGNRPVGYRVPGGFMTDDQLALIREYGFTWDSSLQGTDFLAYYVREGDRLAADGSYEYGKQCDLVEIPVSWQLDDFPAFEFVWNLNSGLRPPSHVLEIWRGDFDFMRRDVPDGVFSPCVHSQIIGRGHRLLMLEELLEYITRVDEVRFETLSSYVARWRGRNPRE
jgi:peptidoglycan/xylan/chitin deacetylase (PgdA/CDA1 family)